MKSSYLTNIAIRNNPDVQSFLTPSIPATAVHDQGRTGANEDFAEAVNSVDPSHALEPVGINPDSYLPNQDRYPSQNTKQFQPLINNDSAETGASEKMIEMPYFARHTERIIVNEKRNVNEADIQIPSKTSNPTVRFKGEEEYLEKGRVSKDSVPADRINEAAELNAMLKIEPSVKDEQQKTTTERINISKLTRLMPVPDLPTPAKNRAEPVLNKQVTPKLVIGKITVEILPPAISSSPKVVTRVVQSALTENHSKMSRLSFGLGQL